MTSLRDGDLAEAARLLAERAHAGQVDKQGRDYHRHHLQPVAEILRPFGPVPEAAGWLHDVLEDTSVTERELTDLGFPVTVVEAVRLVTRVPGESYPDMIARVATHRLATMVKLADNHVNLTGLDQLALTPGGADDARRLRARYTQARALLTAALAGTTA